MNRTRSSFLILTLAIAPLLFAQEASPAKPDTLLLLKNGAEVRGVFVEIKDDKYFFRLTDGRTMAYPASEVDSMKPIETTNAAISLQASAAPATSAGAGTAQQMPQDQHAPAIDPKSCRVFITEKGMDPSFYKVIKDIVVSKKWYGSTSEMYEHLAEKARKTGADAVISVHTWYSPSGFSWAAPHAGGVAVKLTEAGRKALPGCEGRCY